MWRIRVRINVCRRIEGGEVARLSSVEGSVVSLWTAWMVVEN